MCYGSTYYSEAFLGDVTATKGTVLDADPARFLLILEVFNTLNYLFNNSHFYAQIQNLPDIYHYLLLITLSSYVSIHLQRIIKLKTTPRNGHFWGVRSRSIIQTFWPPPWTSGNKSDRPPEFWGYWLWGVCCSAKSWFEMPEILGFKRQKNPGLSNIKVAVAHAMFLVGWRLLKRKATQPTIFPTNHSKTNHLPNPSSQPTSPNPSISIHLPPPFPLVSRKQFCRPSIV